MKLCPVAIAVGCAKCPIYKPCPLKGVIGDYVAPNLHEAETKMAMPAKKPKSKK